MKIYVLLIGALLLINSCSPDRKHHDHSTTAEQKYTCPMHPQVVQDGPGTCPICKMDLVPVSSSSAQSIILNDNQVLLADIKTSKVTKEHVGSSYFANGKIVTDETRLKKVSARVTGRIDRLFIKENGTMIEKGAPIYELYSDELQVLQREYLLSMEQFQDLQDRERFKRIMESAEKKLALYGVSKKQIDQIKNEKRLLDHIVFYSPAKGYVAKLQVTEGQYVQEGQTLFEIQNNTTLWVEAELYPSETAFVKEGDKIKIRVPGFESMPEEATVSFLSPEFRSNTQISMMRAGLDNKEGRYKPGMQAQVIFTSSTRSAIAVPIDAVIRDGKGAHLYVKTGPNTYVPRNVKIGSENVAFAEVTDGLKEGEEVVVSGAYLLYSEMVLKKGISSPEHAH